MNQSESTDSPIPAVGVNDKPAASSEPAPEQAMGEVEVQHDISVGIPEMSLRPQAESAKQQQQHQQVSGSGGKGRLSISKSGKSAGKGDKSKSSRRQGKKDRTSSRRGHKRELIDDNQSEVSYQPDTDLSRSKASKKVFTG